MIGKRRGLTDEEIKEAREQWAKFMERWPRLKTEIDEARRDLEKRLEPIIKEATKRWAEGRGFNHDK